MVSIALADDNDLLRKALRVYLGSIPSLTVLFDAKNGQDLLDQIQEAAVRPDIVLMDFNMPVLDGRETTRMITKLYPTVKVIILSIYHHDYLIGSMISAGARGFMSKNIDAEILEKAIGVIMNEQYFIEVEKGQYQIFNFTTQKEINKVFSESINITDKQKNFLRLCASGLTYTEIADKMGISVKTVDNYRDMLFERFNVANRVELALFAVQNGITDVIK